VLRIGGFQHNSRVILAPMSGIADRPFRQVSRQLGTYWSISEMVTSRQDLWDKGKSVKRLPDFYEEEPRWVQILGTDAGQMAEAATRCVELGAQIIDINMGCPARKVCRRLSGSALMRDETLVAEILAAVVTAVDVPVTLKMRLGWSKNEMNAVNIARMAEDLGVQLLTIHGRTRACGFSGSVDYDAIAEVKSRVSIPVVANGDITHPEQARQLMNKYKFDGVMIGRAARGKPWLPAEISSAIGDPVLYKKYSDISLFSVLTTHLVLIYEFYGKIMGVRMARKHFGWYLQNVANSKDMVREFNRLASCNEQQEYIKKIISENKMTRYQCEVA